MLETSECSEKGVLLLKYLKGIDSPEYSCPGIKDGFIQRLHQLRIADVQRLSIGLQCILVGSQRLSEPSGRNEELV